MARTSRTWMGGFVACAATAFLMLGCQGQKGQDGANGTNGSNGTDGKDGSNATIVVNAATLTPEQWADLAVTGTITNVDMTGTKPVVDFKLVDKNGYGIKGFGDFKTLSKVADRSGNFATLYAYPNLAFAIAKLVPEDATSKAPSKWVSYIVSTVPTKKADGTAVAAAPTRPGTDNNGTLVDNGNGTYRYTFYRDIKGMQAWVNAQSYTLPNDKADLGDVSYDATKLHRIVLQLSGAARGTGSNTPDGITVATAVNMNNPANFIYDFIPGTTATSTPIPAGTDNRDVVAIGKCNECHDKLAFHGGGRVEARYCVVCHTDQRKYGYAVASAGTTTTYTGSTNKFKMDNTSTFAAGDMTAMVHMIHQGTALTKTGYNYANVKYEKLGYSMLDNGQRMCSKCHSGTDANTPTPQGENWNMKPSRLACGTCHDAIDWQTGTNHTGGAALNDKQCAECHAPGGIKLNHQTQNITEHNPTVAQGLTSFTYDINTATQATAGGDVTVKFRILATTDGSTPAPVTFVPAAASVSNPLAGFTGGPSFLLAWAMSQPGESTAPIDFNNLKADGTLNASNHQPPTISIANLLSTGLAPSRGSISGPDSSGYYTATIAAAYAFPVGAKMRTVALQGYFTQVSPAAARHAISAVKTVTGDTARRRVVENAKCASCHEWFEGHGGNRVYEIAVCVTCHVPGLTTSGKGISDAALSTYYNAGLFTAQNKESLKAWTGIDFVTGNPVAAGATNVALSFPQVTNNMKDMIHGIHAGKDRTTNTFKIVRDRTPSAINVIDGGLIGYPGILKNCEKCHTYNGYSGTPANNTLATRDEAINVAGNTTPALAKAALATMNAGDLMTTPFTAACVSCHDSNAAAAHMKLNGGQIKTTRATLNSAMESCAVCHGAGATYDPAKAHK